MMTTTTAMMTISQVARREIVKCQAAMVLARLLPGTGRRGQRLLSEAFNQGKFRRLEFYAAKEDGERQVLLCIELDIKMHRQLLLVHPTIEVDKNWVKKVHPELNSVVGCFEDLVARFNLTVCATIRLNSANLRVAGISVPKVSRSISSYPKGWIPAVQDQLTRLEELNILYAFTRDLSDPA
jgi:hypothetical protein